ncbi:MAG: tetratricopeptide repeat protein [Chloroflexi bacterium]|nr:tetratricopeptide repeat protein [Chloroflexota bacterium]
MITLQSCLEDAKSALLASDAHRAIDLCVHVLSRHPKSIAATCLLAEACREVGSVDYAEDAFRRVLSADPENLIARWALSIMSEEKNDREQARWELERAYEFNPGHGELHAEVRRLSGAKPALTRAGLARIYARGAILDRAADEYQAVLADESNRLDLLVGLAEVLWRSRQIGEARQCCEQIIADAPDCLKANIILGHVYVYAGEQSRAQGEAHLQRARELDPENTVAVQLFEGTHFELLLPQTRVEIPALDGESSPPLDAGTAKPDAQLGTQPATSLPEEDLTGAVLPEDEAPEEGSCPEDMGDKPGDYLARIEYAEERQRAGDLEAAIREYEAIVRSEPALITRVIENLRALVEASPGHSPALRTLGDAYLKIGRFQQAIDSYNLGLKKK